MDAFELRLWDSRLARWTSTDPYGQFHSPYLGMGNNPVSGVDPNGGWSWTTAIAGFAVGGGIGYGLASVNGVKGKDRLVAAFAMGLAMGVSAGASFTGELSLKNLKSTTNRQSFTQWPRFGRPALEGVSPLVSEMFTWRWQDKSYPPPNNGGKDFNYEKTNNVGAFRNSKGQTLLEFMQTTSGDKFKIRAYSYSTPFENHSMQLGSNVNGTYHFELFGEQRTLRGGQGERLFHTTYNEVLMNTFTEKAKMQFNLPFQMQCDCYESALKIKLKYRKK